MELIVTVSFFDLHMVMLFIKMIHNVGNKRLIEKGASIFEFCLQLMDQGPDEA